MTGFYRYLLTHKNSWFSCLSGGFFFAFTLSQMSILNAASEDIMYKWSLSPEQFSNLESLYFLSAGIFFIPIGLLLDTISIKKIMLAGMSMCILGTVLFGTSYSFKIAEFSRFISGIGYSASLLGCFRLAALQFPERIGFISGIMIMLGLLGSVFSQIPFLIAIKYLGWQNGILLYAVIGIIILMFMFMFMFINNNISSNNIFYKIPLNNKFKNILACPTNWLSAIYACLLNTPILFFGDLWGNIYLMQVVKKTNLEASHIITMLFLGLGIGCAFLGIISDLLKSRKKLLLASPIFLFILISPIFFTFLINKKLMLLLYFMYGFLASTQSLVYPLMAKKNIPQNISLATGFCSALIMIGNSLLQNIFGKLISFNTSHVNSVPDLNFERGLIVIPISLIFCFIFALCIQEH